MRAHRTSAPTLAIVHPGPKREHWQQAQAPISEQQDAKLEPDLIRERRDMEVESKVISYAADAVPLLHQLDEAEATCLNEFAS